MNILSNKAIAIQHKLDMFHSQPSDYSLIMTNLPMLISLLEEIESFSVHCRKAIAGYQKELPFYNGLIDKVSDTEGKKFLSGIEKNVTVVLDGNVLKITLFPLIKNLSSRTKEYLSLLIGDEIKRYFAKHTKPDFSQGNCVVVINSIYAKPELVRDNDSVEISAIINVLKTHFLKDDDGLHLSVYRMGSISDRHETEVYLMQQSEFVRWLLTQQQAHKNQTEEGIS